MIVHVFFKRYLTEDSFFLHFKLKVSQLCKESDTFSELLLPVHILYFHINEQIYPKE